MLLKKLLRTLGYIFLFLILAYFIFVFVYGGFGKKEPVFLSAGKKDKVLLFAHRGISLYYPENSIEGVQGARLHGFRASEVDIRRSADGQQIIFHDEDCARLLGVERQIDGFTVSELAQHPILYLNGTKSKAIVPTVSRLLDAEKENMAFYFDMKFSSFKDADDIVAQIKRHHLESSVILANWDILFLFYVEMKYPEIITAIEGFDSGKEWTYNLIPRNLKPDFLSGFYAHTNKEHITWLKKNDLLKSRIVYGVDSSNYVPALKAGFRNIIIDYDSSMNNDPRISDLLKH